MDLGIKGFLPVSMLDWDGNLVSTLFTGGCNFRCPYCHNSDLVVNSHRLEDISFEVIEKHLIAKDGWLDGVVVTGGEPLIHPRLNELLKRIKSLGYCVKLDTNGALPGALQKLLEEELVDYVAMDIKTSFVKYQQVTKLDCYPHIKKSIQLLIASGISHEFRTTTVPGFVTEADVLQIAHFIKEGDKYFLQQFNSQYVLESQASNIIKYPDSFLLNLAEKCSKIIPTKVRGVELRLDMAEAV
jgi:pyruvate formate lyase activating enzyme